MIYGLCSYRPFLRSIVPILLIFCCGISVSARPAVLSQKSTGTVKTYTPDSKISLNDFLVSLGSSDYQTVDIQLLAGTTHQLARCFYFFNPCISSLKVRSVERNEKDGCYIDSQVKANIVFTGICDGNTCARLDDAFFLLEGFGDALFSSIGFSIDPRIVAKDQSLQYFLKFQNGGNVRLRNVSVALDNGTLTCFNSREVSRVAIVNCNFSNDVQRSGYLVSGVKPGGIIWTSGAIESLDILCSVFRHKGVDEFIAVIPSQSKALPHDYVHSIRNVNISGNEFIYGDGSADVPNHKAICFLNDRRPFCQEVENVYIAHNKFRFDSPCFNTFVFDNIRNLIRCNNIRFQNNEITHSKVYTASRITDVFVGGGDDPAGESTDRFDFRSSTGYMEPVEISGNAFIASEQLDTLSGNHYFIRVDGASVLLDGNRFDADGLTLKLSCEEKNQPVPTSFNSLIKIDSNGGNVIAVNNTSTGIGLLGTISEGRHIKKADISMSDNNLGYHQGFYCNNLKEFNLRLNGNFFESTGWCLIGLGCSETGSVYISNNLWNCQTTDSNYPYSVLFSHSSAAVKKENLNFTYIVGNAFKGGNSIIDLDIPPSKVTSVFGNSFNSSETSLCVEKYSQYFK